ncbi:CoA transferase [Gluconacetobacter azotocaptans]|uniref:CaiB/BaiF CoA transferase family protein n=1 Tax=Gluconacetobacter azotocaptans TaxID=142834 RepID=UPI001957F350|nr:CaiB/BaiF CoA-transferase family protein [Gluconacetobacter azotocaptans]MBM9399999.1 CoA transferase [Gluconacetobacter azotocaptans]
MMNRNGTSPLAGIRVVDFTQVMMGPCATQMLGDYGADVIKIERRGSGDLSRWSIGDDPAGAQNPVFSSLNRNKRSIALDLKSAEGQRIVHDLLADADVIASNFRAGVMDRMGLGYETLRARYPKLIYAIGSGFGLGGPYAHKGGQDILAQALTGVMARKCDSTDPLLVYPTSLADYSAGMHMVQGILLALLQRERTGEGQMIEVSLYDSMLAMQMQEAAMALMRGVEFSWGALPFNGAFATTDGALVVVGAFKENPLREICLAIGIADLSLDARFSTFSESMKHRTDLHAILRARFASDTTAHWIAALEARDLLCAPVQTMLQALDDPQTAANGMVLEQADPERRAETLRVIASPVHLSGSTTTIRRRPPRLGADGRDILGELGYSADRIASLEQAKVI